MANEKEVSKILLSHNLTISVAESCTGGLISHRLTNIPGSSKYFKMGIVAYENIAKIEILGVKLKTIQDFGAVSSQTACEMALRIKKLSNTNIGLGVTGIAGPGGGSAEKPVGLVFIAISTKTGVNTKKFLFSGSREEIKNKATDAAFCYILDAILIS